MKNMIILLMVLLMGCGELPRGKYESMEAGDLMDVEMEEASAESVMNFANNGMSGERKTIKTANVNMQVENLDSMRDNLNNILLRFNAYVSEENRNNEKRRLSLNMTIRVDEKQMDRLLGEVLRQASYVYFNNINNQDVTEEFIDVQIRLKNKKAVEAQYITLLTRALKVEDILKIENELRVIREEIEAREGRLKYLSDQVSRSTIHLSAYQEVYNIETAPAKGFWASVRDNFVSGWDLLKKIVMKMIGIWPVLLLIVTGGYLLRRKWLGNKMRFKSPMPVNTTTAE